MGYEIYPDDNRYTENNNHVYGIVLFWPKNNEVELGSVAHNSVNSIELLGVGGNLNHRAGGSDHTVVTFPKFDPDTLVTHSAYVLKITTK